MLATVIFATRLLGAEPIAAPAPGRLIVAITTKGQYSGPTDLVGMQALAAVAHKYGFPVTWHLKAMHAREVAAQLEAWHRQFGDEVGWLADGTSLQNAPSALAGMQAAVNWQPIRSVAQIRYGAAWVDLFEKNGVTSVWGRCFEQTYADGIADRGSPFGFYYLRPEVFKAPNNKPGGLVSVPWLSNDINLVYRLGWQSSYTFDPDDVLSIGGITANNIDYWKALVDEYIQQGHFNAVNPLIIQDEYPSVGNSVRGKRPEKLAVLDKLFAYLKEKNVLVVSQARAVELYKEAYPRMTPPTYALYANLGNQKLVRTPSKSPSYPLHTIKTLTERLTSSHAGPGFNGYYANDFREESNGTKARCVYSHDGRKFYERGRLFVYYDVNGLLMFDEGKSLPERITSYYDIPKNSHQAVVLPEMSQWYDTARYIPQAHIVQESTEAGLTVSVAVPAVQPNVVSKTFMAYGVMLWGDFSMFTVPAGAPVGTRILDNQGLFIPMLLTIGQAKQVQLTFPKR